MNHIIERLVIPLLLLSVQSFEALQTWPFPVTHSLLCLRKDPLEVFPTTILKVLQQQ